jgi:protein TonB
MAVARPHDEPWRRLPWLLPPATLLALLSLAGFLRLLAQPPEQPSLPLAVDVALVELPAPVAPTQATASEPEPAPPQSPPEPEIVPPRAEPPVEGKSEPPPVGELQPPPPPKLVVKPRAPKPVRLPRPPVPQPAPGALPPVSALPPPATPAPAPPSVQPAPPAGGTTSARAIYQPMPEIPDELRRRRLDAVAVVVFRVHPDGSAAVELREATDDPRLNQALLDGFRRWRFFPALDHDKPVASILELRVPVQVR